MVIVAPTELETIHTRERRFLVQRSEPLRRLVLAHGSPIEYEPGRPETLLTTLYLDTPEGTWSVGLTHVKFRCRSYLDPEWWWFEMKHKHGPAVHKWRRRLPAGELPDVFSGARRWPELDRFIFGDPLVPLFATCYYRTAFEWGTRGAGTRLTLDRDIWFFTADPIPPYSLRQRIGGLKGVVVELKSESPAPGWLLDALKECHVHDFSKSSRALECLRGHE